jgi:hypothetical protein
VLVRPMIHQTRKMAEEGIEEEREILKRLSQRLLESEKPLRRNKMTGRKVLIEGKV